MIRALIRYLHTFTGFGRDARLFLVTTVVYGAVVSLYWADFNLYLGAIGLDPSMMGWLMSVSMLAGVLVALPCGALSDRIGRRAVMGGGMALVAVALLAVLPGNVALLFVGVAALGAGSQAVSVVQIPYIAEHTRPEQRNEYFATWSAIGNLTALVATLGGGAAATVLASDLGLGGGPAPYRVLLVGIAVLGALALLTILPLASDRPGPDRPRHAQTGRFGTVISDRALFVRLLLPGFITSLGAGQLIPFLNVFIQTKFNLNLASINAVLALTSLGTTMAILAQPALARRFGRIGSIVLVQASSIPFLLVLGFSPLLWTVIAAMAVRNSLMNAGSPIFDAFAMERVSVAERATLAAGMTLLWSLGWTLSPLYYSALQNALGFTAGYTVDFVTIIVLYTVSTGLLWKWFRGADREAPRAIELGPVQPTIVETPASLLEHA
ncbi:MAG: MFS transporter [Candidatus Limnocylindrales bacterium]